MDNRYYENVINEMKPFLDEQGFALNEEGIYSNATKAIEVKYDEAKQMYVLSVADIAEDNTYGEYREINSWLFDDSQNAKDATAVGIDFVNSLRKELGVKVKRVVDGNSVELPTANKSGSMNVTGFAKKMLDVFPALKDEYKNHISLYGNFLYLNFFGEHLVPRLKRLFSEGNKKQIKKFYDILADTYVKGDKDTVNVMVAVLCAAAYQDENCDKNIRNMLQEDKHFLSSYENFLPVLSKNKKLLQLLVK